MPVGRATRLAVLVAGVTLANGCDIFTALGGGARLSCANDQACPAGMRCISQTCQVANDGAFADGAASSDRSAADATADAAQPDRGHAEAGRADTFPNDTPRLDRAPSERASESGRDGAIDDTPADRWAPDAAPDATPDATPDAGAGDSWSDAGCLAGCAGHALGTQYCADGGDSVLGCSLGNRGCAEQEAIAVCAGAGDCAALGTAAWCQPEIISFAIAPDSWTPPESVTVILQTENADVCSWGANAMVCDGATILGPTVCTLGCTTLELHVCNADHCASQTHYFNCLMVSTCECVLGGVGGCP